MTVRPASWWQDDRPKDPPLIEIAKIIEREYSAPWTTLRLARRVRLPRFAFEKAYEDAFGMMPLAHLRGVRIREAERLLREGVAPAEAARSVGYTDRQRFEIDYRRVFRGDVKRLSLLSSAMRASKNAVSAQAVAGARRPA